MVSNDNILLGLEEAKKELEINNHSIPENIMVLAQEFQLIL